MKTVVFRPTNACNLRCTYCYDKDNHQLSEKAISKKVTETFQKEEENIIKALDILYQDEKYPQIILHGGEPLLIETKVLDKFCENLKNKGIDISIQTNGTLITDEVIELLKRYDISIGLSLDGSNEKQNYQRIYPDGNNSFNRVMTSLNKLKQEKIKFGIIMSVAKQHIGVEQELYDFIGKNDLYCNIRPVFASCDELSSTIMTEEEFAQFFTNLFDIWFYDEDKKVSTHQILELYQTLKGQIDKNFFERGCNNSPNCFRNFISLDVYSNLYACNRLYGIPEFYYGNLKKQKYIDIKEKIEKLIELRQKAISKNCGDCEEFNRCNGGCPAESYDIYHDIIHPAPICKSKKLIYNHVRGILNDQKY